MMLNENDFSFGDEVSLAEIEGETEHVEAEIISDPEQFEKMSLSVQKKNKEALANLKTKVMYTLDQRKLEEAEKIFTGLENIGEVFSDPEIMQVVKSNTTTAQDLKFLADAYSRMLDSQQRLMRLDSVDGQGTAKKLSIGVRFEDDSGTKVDTVIKMGD